jgi:hypothetical protein
MVSKIQNKGARTFLDPSAGKGDIIDFLQNIYRYRTDRIAAIEIDETLQATLRGKEVNVIDSDFLTFSGADKFDVICMNPPFINGHEHLLKAIDIMYCGEIICLLNAATLKNPHTHMRERLVKKLTQLNADIEYIQDAFLDAERKTSVEIALVYIRVENQVEDDLFAGIKDTAPDTQEQISTDNEIQTQNKIKNMVDDFNRVVRIGTETLVNYYKNYNHISKYIKLVNQDGKADSNYAIEDETLTIIMQKKLNQFLRDVRKSFWTEVLQLEDVKKRLTEKKRDVFYSQLQKQAYMNFTENNIRNFILNIINNYEKTLEEAVVELFDKFTQKYAWEEEFHNGNVHYFNGWKSNKAFFVNKKIVMPYYKFIGWSGQWEVAWDDVRKLDDIDTVMSYFDGMGKYLSIVDALKSAFLEHQNRKILSTFFEVSVFKKGTIHLTFRDENIRRRFNITACKGKGWLPQDYGYKNFNQLSYDKQAIVESFEDKKTYDNHLMDCSFRIQVSKMKLLGHEVKKKKLKARRLRRE